MFLTAIIFSNIQIGLLIAMSLVIVFCVAIIAVFWLRQEKLKKLYGILKRGINQMERGEYQKQMPENDDADVNFLINRLNEIYENLTKSKIAIINEKARLDFVLSGVAQGIVVFSENKAVTLINKAARRIFNVKRSVVGKDVTEVVKDDKLLSVVEKVLNTKENTTCEYAPGEAKFLVEISFNESVDESKVMLVLTDITDIKKTENMRSEFFANASHELKTPITSIVGFTELIENDKEKKNIDKYISYIIKDSKRMMHLIEDMLQLSSLDAGVEKGEKEIVDLRIEAMETKINLQNLISKMGVTVDVQGNAKIFAVKNSMAEVMENLVSNAVRYNKPKGKVEVFLEESDDYIKLKVSDTGIGIPQGKQERLFERFYRVDMGRSKFLGGTGLGLSIVKHIAELYNAKIELKSRLAEGTSVAITFPKNKNSGV